MTEITTKLNVALADRYLIERELGAGGMATVYLAAAWSGSRAEARARPSSGALKGAHASASRCLAEPALQSGTAMMRSAAR